MSYWSQDRKLECQHTHWDLQVVVAPICHIFNAVCCPSLPIVVVLYSLSFTQCANNTCIVILQNDLQSSAETAKQTTFYYTCPTTPPTYRIYAHLPTECRRRATHFLAEIYHWVDVHDQWRWKDEYVFLYYKKNLIICILLRIATRRCHQHLNISPAFFASESLLLCNDEMHSVYGCLFLRHILPRIHCSVY